MTTALDIITKAMQKCGILTKTESPDADETADALDCLNALLSSWSNESMLIYTRALENFPLVAGTISYSIGSGQTFNTTRPTQILSAYVRQGSVDYPVEVINDENYAKITFKTMQGIPTYLNLDNGFPAGTIKLYPSPLAGLTLFILSEKVLSSFALSDTVSLPPGWERALVYNLAVEISPEYGQQVDPLVLKIANDSKGAIQRAIIKMHDLDAQPAMGSKSHVYNGGFA